MELSHIWWYPCPWQNEHQCSFFFVVRLWNITIWIFWKDHIITGLHNFPDFWLICLICDDINCYLFLDFKEQLKGWIFFWECRTASRGHILTIDWKMIIIIPSLILLHQPMNVHLPFNPLFYVNQPSIYIMTVSNPTVWIIFHHFSFQPYSTNNSHPKSTFQPTNVFTGPVI